MDYTVRFADERDYDRIIKFISEVFELDFAKLLPKFYKNNAGISNSHIIVERDGDILASAAYFLNEVDVCGKKLTLAIVGSVSVSSQARGLGLMRIVMDKIMEKIDSLNVDFAILSGHRQRYEHWGFTTAGMLFEAEFEDINVKHLGVNGDISFREAANSSENAALLQKVHNKKAIRYVRKKADIINISASYFNKIFLVYFKDKYIGYIISKNQNITEINLTKELYLKVVIAFMVDQKIKATKCILTPIQFDALKEFSLGAERYSIKNNCNLKIYNYANVLRAYLEYKNTICTLTRGKKVIQIGKEKYLIEIGEGITVEKTCLPSQVKYSDFFAIQKMFTSYGNISDGDEIENWFPLPFYIETVDNA